METSAFVHVLQLAQKGMIRVVGSEALEYENSRNPSALRRVRVSSFLALAVETLEVTDADIDRADALTRVGLSDFDALHIALAERGEADFFVTCDDDIIKCCKRHVRQIGTRVIGLLEFISREMN